MTDRSTPAEAARRALHKVGACTNLPVLVADLQHAVNRLRLECPPEDEPLLDMADYVLRRTPGDAQLLALAESVLEGLRSANTLATALAVHPSYRGRQ